MKFSTGRPQSGGVAEAREKSRRDEANFLADAGPLVAGDEDGDREGRGEEEGRGEGEAFSRENVGVKRKAGETMADADSEDRGKKDEQKDQETDGNGHVEDVAAGEARLGGDEDGGRGDARQRERREARGRDGFERRDDEEGKDGSAGPEDSPGDDATPGLHGLAVGGGFIKGPRKPEGESRKRLPGGEPPEGDTGGEDQWNGG